MKTYFRRAQVFVFSLALTFVGRFILALCSLLIVSVPYGFAQAQQPQVNISITGSVREKGTKKPLGSVNVYCFSPPESTVPLKSVTDMAGGFSLSVPPGQRRWKISVAGYKVFEKVEDKPETGSEGPGANSSGGASPLKFYLERNSYIAYETTVFGDTEKRDDKTQTLTQDQFMTLPGSNGDPVKAVQNLPGINRANDLSAQVIIEGSAPQDTRYSIDTQPVPIIFHFSGLTSVVMPEAVDHVDYLSAGFGPEWGQSTAGYVNLYTTNPPTDRTHGMAFVDIFNVGGMVETPLNDHSSFYIGMRKSYIGEVLGAVANKAGQDKFDLTVAPDFDDGIMMYTNKLTSKDTLKIVAVGSIDTLEFVLPQPPDQDPGLQGNFDFNTSFYRLIPEYTHQFSSDTFARVWAGLGQDSAKEDFGSYFYHSDSKVASARAEVETKLNHSWKTYIGTDNNVNWNSTSYQIPFSGSGAQSGVGSPPSVASQQMATENYFLDSSAIYWRNVLHNDDSRWTYEPGLRLGYYNQTHEFLPEPRLAARYALDHGLTLRAATGLYYEAPPPIDLDPNYGNPNLTSESAVHVTVGAEKDFRGTAQSGWFVSSDVFYKYLYNLVEATSATTATGQPEYYDNDGTGNVIGIEFLIKYQSNFWNGWVAYTLSRSTRAYPPAGETLFQYDQTHILTAVASRDIGHNWKFSGRFRFTSGDPYTPLVGANYDVDNDVYIPISGGAYSQRMSPFYELDARFDRKWVFNSWILTWYVDVENLTNHKNVEQINYSYNYQQTANVTGLPILPTVGLKGEF